MGQLMAMLNAKKFEFFKSFWNVHYITLNEVFYKGRAGHDKTFDKAC